MSKNKISISGNYTLPEIKEALLFCTPLFLFLGIFVLLPVLGTLLNTLYKDVSFLTKQFILFENYRRLFCDQMFWQALKFTLLFIFVSVPAELVLGLAFALILNINIPFRGFWRACVLIPWVIPSAISARIWELIYNYSYGLANFLFLKAGFGHEAVNWLGTSPGAFTAIVIADVWKTVPFVAIIFLAGLQTIPPDLYAQARVDRANFLQTFFKVTLPLLKPVIVVALLFRTIDALRIFDLIYVLTGGGPGGATSSISLYAYKYFLSGDFGYGSTLSVLLFLIALLFSIFYVKASRFSRQTL